ncbi:MAG: alkaline phosphatase family protein [Dehalococcoidia bacterium]
MRDDVERLRTAIASGRLLHPVSDRPGLVDLARALAATAGVPRMDATRASVELAGEIGNTDHLVLVVIDGLGAEHLEGQESAPFLRGQMARRLITPFPSTTAVALTSLATGEWPARHSVTGWWTYLPGIEASVTALPFTRRGDDVALESLGVTPEEAFPVPSMWAECPRDVLCVQPSRIAGTTYSTYQTGGHPSKGYGPLQDAFEAVVQHVLGASGPTFTYLYFPQFDTAAHDRSVLSAEARHALVGIDSGLAALAARLEGRARLVITSDHGHAFVPDERRYRLRATDALALMLRALPSGDMRAPSFHVLPQRVEEFEGAFRTRFGEKFALLTPNEVDELRLLGPEPMVEETRRRLGDFLAVSLDVDVLGYVSADGNRRALQQPSHHSGLTPAEMLIPLILA